VLLMATSTDALREEVRRYAESVRAVTDTSGSCGCGSGSCCADGESDAPKFGEALYEAEQRGELPQAAMLASLGCGNPTSVAELREGESVLDLGSGGGIDVILSAKRVGPTGVESNGCTQSTPTFELALAVVATATTTATTATSTTGLVISHSLFENHSPARGDSPTTTTNESGRRPRSVDRRLAPRLRLRGSSRHAEAEAPSRLRHPDMTP